MRFFVYILYSEKLKRFYTGTTDDVMRRLEEHNSKIYSESFSSRGVPWQLFYFIECETSQQAYRLEAFIKQMKSSKFIERLKTESELTIDLLSRFK